MAIWGVVTAVLSIVGLLLKDYIAQRPKREIAVKEDKSDEFEQALANHDDPHASDMLSRELNRVRAKQDGGNPV